MYKNIENVLEKLSKSKFRTSFKLKQNDFEYIKQKGLEVIRLHAYDFVNKRLSDISNINDGKQTPMKGHPVFIAQHATATCCRECLQKWHNINKDKILSKEEIDYIVNVIMNWIILQINKFCKL